MAGKAELVVDIFAGQRTGVGHGGGGATLIASPAEAAEGRQALLSRRPMKESLAWRLLDKPLVRAAAMLTAGEAEVMVAGAVAPPAG